MMSITHTHTHIYTHTPDDCRQFLMEKSLRFFKSCHSFREIRNHKFLNSSTRFKPNKLVSFQVNEVWRSQKFKQKKEKQKPLGD
jgi:hypothetical protein